MCNASTLLFSNSQDSGSEITELTISGRSTDPQDFGGKNWENSQAVEALVMWSVCYAFACVQSRCLTECFGAY